jgi:MFS family permease
VLYAGIVIVVASTLSLGSAGYLEDDKSFFFMLLVARLLQGAQGATFNTTNRAVLLNMSKTSELAS